MDIDALIAQHRVDSDDLVPDYLSTSDQITTWLNEAEQEACIRSRLILDVNTPSVCNIAVTAPANVFTLHPAIFEISRAAFTPTGETCDIDLFLTDRVYLDSRYRHWRTRVEQPREAIHTDKQLQLACIPCTDGTIALEAYRLPLKNIEDQSNESPEIAEIHHRHLVHWSLYRCYSRPDAEIHDPARAEKELAEFTKVFGIRPDADYRKASQADRPQFNQAYW